MDRHSFHDGSKDGLIPLEALALDGVQSFAELLRGMSKTAFSGRQLGEAFAVLLEMFRDPGCHVVLTVSGAMTVAKQGRIFCDLIDRGLIDSIVATGALIAHGLTESIGRTHFRYDPAQSDQTLYEQGYNRIYDTLEMEANLNDVATLVSSTLESCRPEDGVWSSARFCHAVGRRLSELAEGPGILRSAYERDVPVFLPAFVDSEIGLDMATWAMSSGRGAQEARGADSAMSDPQTVLRGVPPFNPFLDLQQYTRRVLAAEKLGILTIGGGVPRNWAQQVGPYVEITNRRLGTTLEVPRFCFGVRICPEPVHWGGLSGCTYLEGVSWGKFVSPAEGGRYAEVYADATVALPLLIKGVFEELDRKG